VRFAQKHAPLGIVISRQRRLLTLRTFIFGSKAESTMQQNFEKEFSESRAFLEQLAEFLRVPPLAGSCSPVTKFRFRLESRTGVSGKFREEVLGYGTTSEIMTFRIRPRVTSCPLVFSRLENFMFDRKFEPILISFREMPNFFGKPFAINRSRTGCLRR